MLQRYVVARRLCHGVISALILCLAGACGELHTVAQKPVAGAETGSVGVMSPDIQPKFDANEIPKGRLPVRGEEAAGILGGGLAAGLGTLAACAPAVYLAPLCALVAATMGLTGAAAGGVVGDWMADHADTKSVFSSGSAPADVHQALRIKLVERLRQTGRVADDLGRATVGDAPDQELPDLLVETFISEIQASGQQKNNFSLAMRCQVKLTRRSDGKVLADREHVYQSPGLPVGNDENATAQIAAQAIETGIQELANELAAQTIGLGPAAE